MTQQVHGALSPAAKGGSMPTEGRWGWYRDHTGAEWRRVSTLVKKVETDTHALDKWKLRQVLIGAARRDDLIVAVKAMGAPDPATGWTREQKRTQDELAEKAMEAAKSTDGAITGTAVHTMTERIDRGEPVEQVAAGLPEAVARTLRAYAFMRQANGYRSVEIERTVVCDEVEAAGTFDRIDEIAGLTALLGPWVCQHGHEHGEESQVIVDVKTESAPWLNGLHIGPQLGIYSRSLRMWVPTGGRVPLYWPDSGKPKMTSDGVTQATAAAGEYVATPCVRQDVGVVVHLLDGDATPYFVNLTEGWEAAVAAYEQQQREMRAGRKLGAAGAWFVPVPNVKRLPGPSAAEMATAAAQLADSRGGQHCLVCREVVSPGQVTCRKCGHPVGRPADVSVGSTASGAPVEHVATTRADGMVDWQPAPAPAAGVLDAVDKQAIEAIWAAPDLAHLAKTFEIYTGQLGRTWAGRVAEAGDARRRQIECPQRQLHAGGGKCACGWVAGVPA